ncbi:MAG: alpha/beta hydrolase [Candidatus Woesearchaeota archaeon]
MTKNVQEHIVIFSHGMGVLKDSRGIFTEIGDTLGKSGIQPVLFDYSDYNPQTKEVTVTPFSEQAMRLHTVIRETRRDHPNAIIDIVAHSQGAVAVALAKPKDVRKTILLAPFFHTDIEEVRQRHSKHAIGGVDFSKTTRRKRSDGTITIIPPAYWTERFNTPVSELYNALALKTELTIINASEDEIMDSTNLARIYNATILNIQSNHEFEGAVRTRLKKRYCIFCRHSLQEELFSIKLRRGLIKWQNKRLILKYLANLSVLAQKATLKEALRKRLVYLRSNSYENHLVIYNFKVLKKSSHTCKDMN